MWIVNDPSSYYCCCCCQVASVVSDSVRPHRWQPTRLHRPWDSPGKNTGVGCHFLLQCKKVKSESEVAQSYPILSDPMDCSLPGSSVHGSFQARVLEWGARAFSLLPTNSGEFFPVTYKAQSLPLPVDLILRRVVSVVWGSSIIKVGLGWECVSDDPGLAIDLLWPKVILR